MSEKDNIILQSLLTMMPDFSRLFQDIAIAFSNTEKYLYYKPTKELDHKIKPGDPVKPDSMTDKTFKNKGYLTASVDASVFGVPYNATGIPIFNDKKEIIGGIVFCESSTNAKHTLLKNISAEISKNMISLNKDMDCLKSQSETINSTSNELLSDAKTSQHQIENSNKIVNVIKSIAFKTDMLSINAAIEATRVGKEGAGFKVVANEIRDLSQNTKGAIKNISDIINEININSNNMTSKIDDINNSLENIANFIEEIGKITNQLSESSVAIDNLADSLIK